MADPTRMTPVYDKNPGVMTYFCICWILATEDSCGAFMTMTTEPTIQRKQATLPTRLRRSFRKMADRTVVMTTDSAPSGVTKMASVKA